jgi:hypothetical protein
MKSLLDLAPADLGSVNVEKSVEICRDLLWCHARKHGFPITKIHISSRVAVSDGGVDAKIDDDAEDTTSELLLSPGTCYQIKTGTSFKPWQENQIRRELFGASTAGVNINNLGDEVKRCLEQGNRYIIICFGIDPTAEETDSAVTTLKKYFKQCGFENPQVEVWGQNHLSGLISEFPSIVLKILGKSEYQFQTLTSWARNDDMTPPLKLGVAQEEWIGDIREALRTTNDHLRVIGEPGIGKSRLVLEALSADDLAPNVIYIQHAEDFQKSQLFNELIRSDVEYHVILVVDECPDKERASIWNLLKAYRSKCQLITIDHGPERSVDEAMRVLDCPLLEEEQIAAIINTYIEAKEEARRWASWCSGSPRVAHAVGQNLQKNQDDIFRPPATVPIWERFVAGYEDASRELNQQRLVVLRHIALFQRFGFEPPVSDEARFISGMVNKVDPAITWGKFQSVVEQLRERRILQGSTTLFLVPKALHTYLWLEYWKHYGRGFNIKEFIGALPAGLLKWFTRMFIYAHANPLAQQVVRDILGPGGPYKEKDFAVSELGTSFLSVLAEADPMATLRCIERTYGSWTKETLRKWDTGRQSVVWALEKIAVWPETFSGAARMLLKLGTTESSSYSNNASGTFAGLFSVAYGPAAPSEATPTQRLPVLEEALKSADIDERNLALKACEIALSTGGGFRIIGAEYQGLRPVAKLWLPKTYGEIFDAYRAVWHLLFEVSRSWPDEGRRLANNILISAAHNLVPIESLALEIMTTIEGLLDDPATEMRSVVRFIVDTRRFRLARLQEETLKRINQLDEKIAGSTLEKQIERYVLNSTWSEERDEDIPEEQSIERRVTELAERANSEYADFLPLMEKLTRTEGHKLYQFAFEIGKRDNERKFLKSIIDAQHAAGTKGQTQFIGGYLRALREASEDKWERLIIKLLFDERFQGITGQLIWRTGINNNILTQMLQAYEKNILDARDFSVLQFPQDTRLLDQGLVEEALTALLNRNNEEGHFISLEIADAFFCDREVERKMPRELIYELLTKPDFFADHFDTMQGYQWGILAKKYLETYPERELELFKLIMRHLENWRIMVLKANSTLHSIAELIAKRKPRETWEIVKNLLSDLNTDLAHGVLRWLKEEGCFGEEESGIQPLTYFPADMVLAWIEEAPSTRAPAIARAAPRTLDSSGDGLITREVLYRYGHIDSVKSTLFASFFTGGWSGPASAHYRKKRDQARAWLSGETSSPVIEWLNEYIGMLSSQIKSEEIREEREF